MGIIYSIPYILALCGVYNERPKTYLLRVKSKTLSIDKSLIHLLSSLQSFMDSDSSRNEPVDFNLESSLSDRKWNFIFLLSPNIGKNISLYL